MTTDEHDALTRIAIGMDTLGADENIGKGFVIDPEDIPSGIEQIPEATYPHRVIFDERTENYLVVRPDESGRYSLFEGEDFRIVREVL